MGPCLMGDGGTDYDALLKFSVRLSWRFEG